MLQIYNTLTQQKEIFKPLQPGKVSLYVCGMTVYDYCHIGHARVWVAFDIITRYLRSCGYEVIYIRNITDIDDKIIKRALENNEPYQALTERMITAMHHDTDALNILLPTEEPRATEYIAQMVALIETLLAKGYAYINADGDVCYQVNRFSAYGELAHQNLEQLRAGARVAVERSKQDPLDFVLWKLAKPNEPSWDSPWGAGRPGWHIECSAMSLNCLGQTFDIHGGGLDLVFPHHQNEVAQSEAATGQQFVNTWMHVGFVQVDKEKMSKSLGNFFTVQEVLKEYSAEVVRYFLLASHYRSPINYSTENLQSAHAALERFYITLRGLLPPSSALTPDLSQKERGVREEGDRFGRGRYIECFNSAMDDDFNTPEALAVLFDLARDINRLRNEDIEKASELAAVLRYLGSIFGILQQDPEVFLRGDASNLDTSKIEALIAARTEARKNKNWAEADKIRNELASMGVELEDGAAGTIWRHVTF